jgi:hypothetical protein
MLQKFKAAKAAATLIAENEVENRQNAKQIRQETLNEAHVGPRLEFHANYAQLLSHIFVCFTFSTGMPVLYFICTVNLILFFFVEKYCVCELYSLPPRYSSATGRHATSFLPLALILHFAMSVWVLSNPELFDNSANGDARSGASSAQLNNGSQEKVSGKNTYPLFIFMILLIVQRILVHLTKEYFGSVERVS